MWKTFSTYTFNEFNTNKDFKAFNDNNKFNAFKHGNDRENV